VPICFVIQPFDSGKYDKRFEDVYKPAIEAAGVDAYRVDRDHSVEVPIDAIEEGIRNAAVCLADVTADNPNVWYELGYAFARGRPVAMVCSSERQKFPFDIQHRTIIQYMSESPRDFESLRSSITERIKALLSKREAMRQIEETEQVAPVAGVSQPELFVLASLAGSTYPELSSAALYHVQQEVERAGLTAVGFSLGIRRLTNRGFIEPFTFDDQDGTVKGVRMADAGWDWMDSNEDRFLLRRDKKAKAKTDNSFDGDIPF
jgi:nucleoside 2-deoxyribosyltransferase